MPTYDVARATAVKKIASRFEVTKEYVRAIIKNGTSSSKSEDILKAYQKEYDTLNKIINH